MGVDTVIIKKLRKGDSREFETLFRSSYVSLVRYARSLVSDHDTAEEIVQDFFYRLWKDRENLNIGSSLNGYLFRSVHNSCLHHLQHLKVIARHEAEMANMDQEFSGSASDRIQLLELEGRIANLLDKLPQRCGKVFCMNRFEGLKYTEIASRLEISVKTVEADMGKALKAFRKELMEQ